MALSMRRHSQEEADGLLFVLVVLAASELAVFENEAGDESAISVRVERAAGHRRRGRRPDRGNPVVNVDTDDGDDDAVTGIAGRRRAGMRRRRPERPHRRPGRPQRRPGHGRRQRPGRRGRGRGQRGQGEGAIHMTPRARNLLTAFGGSQVRFSVRLHRQVAPTRPNVVYSPYSVFRSLAMVRLGARGRTAFQMQRGLSLQGVGRRVHPASRKAKMLLEDSGTAHLETVNGIYVKQGLTVLPEFTRAAQVFYHANVTQLSSSGPEEDINSWVAEQTNSKIQTVLSQGDITDQSKVVLVNAVYFKGLWKKAFDVQRTSQVMFKKTATENIPVQMMRMEGNFKIGVVPGHSARLLEIPFEDDRFSMLIILPDDDEGLATVEGALTEQTLSANLDTAVPSLVSVSLPRFKLETLLSLKTTLETMGMARAFNTEADFRGMSSDDNVHITDVIHKAVVEVTEEGTVVDETLATPTQQVICDHPFLFIIKDNLTKLHILIGKFSGGATQPQ